MKRFDMTGCRKAAISLAVAASCMLLAAGCSKKEAASTGDAGGSGSKEDKSNTLVVWSFTDEIGNAIKDYYLPSHPDMNVQYVFTPGDQFTSKLDPVITSGEGAPDVVGLEDAFVRKYVESGLLLPLGDLYAEVKDKMIAYPMQVGSFDGHVYGMAWQVTVSGHSGWPWVAYITGRPSVYGGRTPGVLPGHISLPWGYIEGGLSPYTATARQPGVLIWRRRYPPHIQRLTGYQSYIQHPGHGTPSYIDGRSSPYPVPSPRGYMMPPVYRARPRVYMRMLPILPSDWAMCAGPINFRWGGTWLAAYKGTKNPKAAKEMIKCIATDDDYLEQYASILTGAKPPNPSLMRRGG